MDPQDQQEQEVDPTLNTELEIQKQQESSVDEDSPESMRQRLEDMIGKKEEAPVAEKPLSTEKPKVDPVATEKPAKVEKPGADGFTTSERKGLIEYKEKALAYESRIKELEEKVASGDATAKEAAELKAKNAEWEKKYGEKENELKGWLSKQDPIALEKVRMSDVYQREVVIPSDQIEKSIVEICKGYDVDPEQVIAAHYNKDRIARNKALSEIKSTMDDESKVELTEALRRLAEIDGKAASIERAPQAALAQIREMEEQKTRLTKERETTAYTRARDGVYKHVILEEFPMLKDDAEAAARVKAKVDGIDWEKITPEKKAYLAHGAFLALEMRDANKRLQQENEQLRASVDKMSNKPGLTKSHKEERKTAAKGDEPEKEPDTIEEAWKAWKGSGNPAVVFG